MNIDTFFTILRKSLVGTVLLAFAFVFVYVPQPFNHIEQAEALWPVIDVAQNALTAAGNVILGTIAFLEGSLVVKDFTLDGIAFMIGKAIVSSIIGSLINWINSGFKGKPAFVQDIKRFLLDAADRAAGEFIRKLGGVGSFVCSPFQLDIQIALSIQYQQAREHDEPEECRLSDIVDNLEEFYNGSFNDSSLEDFITITSNPSMYTPYGQLLTAQTQMRMRLANEKGEVLTEADWGGGFLSGKICQAIQGSSGSSESCVISKPGKIIQDALSFNLDTGRQSLVSADEINELISALIGQLANQAITGAAGLLGLSTGTGYTTPGFDGGSYINAAVAEASAASTSAAQNLRAPTPPAGGSAPGLPTIQNEPLGFTADTFRTAIQVQRSAQSAANAAIPDLLDYANDSDNPSAKRSQARAAYNDAVATRNKAVRDEPRIASILSEYLSLEIPANGFVTIVDGDATIARARQLYAEFQALNTLTASQLQSKSASWQPPS